MKVKVDDLAATVEKTLSDYAEDGGKDPLGLRGGCERHRKAGD